MKVKQRLRDEDFDENNPHFYEEAAMEIVGESGVDGKGTSMFRFIQNLKAM